MRTARLAALLGPIALLTVGCEKSTDAPADTDTVVDSDTDTDTTTDSDTGGPVDSDSDVDTDETDRPIDTDTIAEVVPGHWDRGWVVPGFVGESAARVHRTLRLPDGRLVAAGIFDFATDVPTANVAVQAADGTWSALGGGLDGYVEDLAYVGEGALLAAGWIETPDGLEGRVWSLVDGAWVELPGTFDGRVYTLHELADGTVLAGGEFATVDGADAVGLAAWDGEAFVPTLPGFGSSGWGTVRSIVELGSDVCVTGNFDEVDGVAAGGVACHDGAAWSPLGLLQGEAYGLATLGNGRVLAWGGFALGEPPDDFTIGLAELVEGAWVPAPEGGVDGGLTITVRDLLPDGDDGYLIAGQFAAAGVAGGQGGAPAANVARFDGTDWYPLGAGVIPTSGIFAANVEGAYTLRREDDGDVAVGGLFQRADGYVVASLAIWNGTTMEVPFPSIDRPGLEGSGTRAGTGPDGSVWITAEVATNGYLPVLFRLDGERFTDLHDGPGGWVTDLEQGPNGILYVSGQLEGLGRQLCDLASYDGVDWTCHVRGLAKDDGTAAGVTGLAHDGNGNLALVGEFTLPDGSTNVARFDGQSVYGLGDGVSGFGLGKVAIDPATGDVYVGGYSLASDGVDMPGVGWWDASASAWKPLGDGLDGSVSDLAWFAGRLVIAGGYLSVPGGDDLGPLQAWDGAQLTELGPLAGGGAYAFTAKAREGHLLVWATFDTLDGVEVDSTLLHTDDLSTWTPLGVGTDDLVTDVAFADDAVWVVGPFRTAGGSPSFGVAKWLPDAP